MTNNQSSSSTICRSTLLTFLAVTLFYTFESAQMAYYNVLGPAYLNNGYQQESIAALSAAYFYGTMTGLFPIGYVLDHFALRKAILIGIIGSVIGILILSVSQNFYLQWIARFVCGFFGGTACFIGGIRIIAAVFPTKFSYFMGIFLAAGMFAGMLCQYPLLLIVKKFGPDSTLKIMFCISVVVLIVNFFYLQPLKNLSDENSNSSYTGTFWDMFKEIGFNIRNWCDVIMVSLLDTPVSVIGTLWGIVFLTQVFQFSERISSLIMMVMFSGLMIGLPVLGRIADKFNNPPWIVIWGAFFSFVITVFLTLKIGQTPWSVGILFFGLGFFSSCQTMGFTWITQGMRKELIGRNSAINSMVFMGTNGGFKQLGAIILGAPAVLVGMHSASNLMLAMAIAMLIATIYASCRSFLFKTQTNSLSLKQETAL